VAKLKTLFKELRFTALKIEEFDSYKEIFDVFQYAVEDRVNAN